MKKDPIISVIIPTRNSKWILPVCIRGILENNYPKDKVEIIIVDNESSDGTVEYAKKIGARVYSLLGKPPLVCQQRNLGARKARGEWLIFLDHDMELSKNLLRNFAVKLKKNNSAHAWYIPERIVTSSHYLSLLRNFERGFYNQTSIDAVRIIKKTTFFQTETQYDSKFSGGPGDWDLDIQLREACCQFDTIDQPLSHHEERFGGIINYVLKKSDWSGGINRYKKKWLNKYNGKYRGIIARQFGLKYRTINVFIENGKWKKLIKRPDLYLGVMCIKLAMLLVPLTKNK